MYTRDVNRVLSILAVISLIGSGAVALLLSSGPENPAVSRALSVTPVAPPGLGSQEALLADRISGWARGQLDDVSIKPGQTHDLDIRIQVVNEPLIVQDRLALTSYCDLLEREVPHGTSWRAVFEHPARANRTIMECSGGTSRPRSLSDVGPGRGLGP